MNSSAYHMFDNVNSVELKLIIIQIQLYLIDTCSTSLTFLNHTEFFFFFGWQKRQMWIVNNQYYYYYIFIILHSIHEIQPNISHLSFKWFNPTLFTNYLNYLLLDHLVVIELHWAILINLRTFNLGQFKPVIFYFLKFFKSILFFYFLFFTFDQKYFLLWFVLLLIALVIGPKTWTNM